MSHAFGTPLLIANPAAGDGRSAVLERLCAALRARHLDHDVVVTTRAGEATQLARTALEAGRRYVVAVGGDGTVHEVVNGMVDAASGAARGRDPVLAVVPDGSGCDLVRTFGLDRIPPERLAGHLATEDAVPLDLGRVRLLGRDGSSQVRVFHNVAEVGFGATVVDTARRLPRRLGQGRYLAAVVVAWGRFRRVPTTVEVDGGTRTDPLCNVVVANGQFFGGGLHVAPRALPGNGRFNVQAWGGTPTDVLRAGPLLRTGAHLRRDDVREWQSAQVRVEAARRLAVEADGEVLGTTPASFDVLPQVLRFKL